MTALKYGNESAVNEGRVKIIFLIKELSVHDLLESCGCTMASNKYCYRIPVPNSFPGLIKNDGGIIIMKPFGTRAQLRLHVRQYLPFTLLLSRH